MRVGVSGAQPTPLMPTKNIVYLSCKDFWLQIWLARVVTLFPYRMQSASGFQVMRVVCGYGLKLKALKLGASSGGGFVVVG